MAKFVDMDLDGNVDVVVGCNHKNSYGIGVYLGGPDGTAGGGYGFTKTDYWLALSHEVRSTL